MYHDLGLQVQNPPTVSWPVEEGALYTLVMTGKSWLSNEEL